MEGESQHRLRTNLWARRYQWEMGRRAENGICSIILKSLPSSEACVMGLHPRRSVVKFSRASSMAVIVGIMA